MPLLVRLREQGIVAKDFGDEIIAIDLSTGTYYCMGGSAVEIWRMLSAGQVHDRIIGHIQQKFEGDSEVIRLEISDFLDSLENDGIIQLIDQQHSLAEECDEKFDECDPEESRSSRPYLSPSIRKFTDMQELFLLDIVHDFGKDGWTEAG